MESGFLLHLNVRELEQRRDAADHGHDVADAQRAMVRRAFACTSD